MAPPPIATHHAPASSTRHQEREQKGERTSRNSGGQKSEPNHKRRPSTKGSLTRGAASQKGVPPMPFASASSISRKRRSIVARSFCSSRLGFKPICGLWPPVQHFLHGQVT